METVKKTSTEATITLTAEELRILNNAINESLEALGSNEDEFQTRMGISTDKATKMLKAINTLIKQMT